jgi:hypothetical protein
MAPMDRILVVFCQPVQVSISGGPVRWRGMYVGCFTVLWPGKVIGQAGGLGVEADLLRCCGSEVTVGGRG